LLVALEDHMVGKERAYLDLRGKGKTIEQGQ
jgi:hypothetical protein